MLVTDAAGAGTGAALPFFLLFALMIVAVGVFLVRERQRTVAGPPAPRQLPAGRSARRPKSPEPRLNGEVLLYGPWFTTLCHGACGPPEKNLTVRAATVRGRRHRYEGTPGQDALGLVWNPARASLFVVIADGLGSKPDSGEAARQAVSQALDTAGRLQRPENPASVLAEAGHVVRDFHRAGGQGSSTMVVTEIRRARTEVQIETWGIGDSEAWLLNGGRWGALHHERGQRRENVTRHLPHEQARRDRRRVPAGSVLLLATDGFAGALGPGSPLGARLVESWREPPAPLDFLSHVDFDDDKFTDDRAAVAVWIR